MKPSRVAIVAFLVAVSGCGVDAALVADGTALPVQVRRSQAATVSQHVADAEITITYSRPVARGRDLFGALVPYGVVWNPGADRATAIALTRDVTINDQPLAAGKYSIWASPGPKTWTVIFSRAADVFHTPYPGAAQDALRLDVGIEAIAHTEVLTYSFPLVEGRTATLALDWGTVRVPLRIVVP